MEGCYYSIFGKMKLLFGGLMPKSLVKLTQEDLDEIRRALEKPFYGINSQLARRFGVSEKTIRNIRKNTYTV